MHTTRSCFFSCQASEDPEKHSARDGDAPLYRTLCNALRSHAINASSRRAQLPRHLNNALIPVLNVHAWAGKEEHGRHQGSPERACARHRRPSHQEPAPTLHQRPLKRNCTQIPRHCACRGNTSKLPRKKGAVWHTSRMDQGGAVARRREHQGWPHSRSLRSAGRTARGRW